MTPSNLPHSGSGNSLTDIMKRLSSSDAMKKAGKNWERPSPYSPTWTVCSHHILFTGSTDGLQMQEEWINTPYHSNTKPFDSPLEVAKELIANEK